MYVLTYAILKQRRFVRNVVSNTFPGIEGQGRCPQWLIGFRILILSLLHFYLMVSNEDFRFPRSSVSVVLSSNTNHISVLMVFQVCNVSPIHYYGAAGSNLRANLINCIRTKAPDSVSHH